MTGSIQIPVKQDPQTQLAFQQLSARISALEKASGIRTTTSGSGTSPPPPPKPITPIVETFSYTAGVFLYSAVYESSAGTVSLADPSTASTASVIGIVTKISGSTASVTTFGDVKNAGWSWTPDEAVYLAAGGLLSQDIPATGLAVIVGSAPSTTGIRLEAGEALAQNWAAGGYYDIPAGITQVIPNGQISFTQGVLTNEGTIVNFGRLSSV